MAKKPVKKMTEQPPVEEQAATSQDTSIVDINSEVADEETDNEDGPTLVTTGFLKCDGIRYQPGDTFPIDHPEAERLFELGAVKER